MNSTLEMSLWKMNIMMIICYYYICGLNCGDEIKQINWLINKCEWRICFLLTLGILLRICLMLQLGLALPTPQVHNVVFFFFLVSQNKIHTYHMIMVIKEGCGLPGLRWFGFEDWLLQLTSYASQRNWWDNEALLLLH